MRIVFLIAIALCVTYYFWPTATGKVTHKAVNKTIQVSKSLGHGALNAGRELVK